MLCRCSNYLQKTTNTPTLNGGEGCRFFCSLKLPYLSILDHNVSTILSPIVVPFSVTVVINIVKVGHLTHIFFSFFLSFSSLLNFSSRGRVISMHFVQMLGSILLAILFLFLCLFVSKNSLSFHTTVVVVVVVSIAEIHFFTLFMHYLFVMIALIK